jgi:hypothetical protein
MIGTKRWTRLGWLGLVTVMPSACSDLFTGPDGSDDPLNMDVAYVSAEMALAELDEGVPFTGGAFVSAESEGAFSASVTFYDEAGAEMESFHPLLTAAVRFQRSMELEASRDGWSASFSRNADTTVSGLLGQEAQRTWNGTANGHVERSRFHDELGTRTYDMSYTSTTSNVVRAVDRGTQPWPLSGSIFHEVTVVATGRDGTLVTRERTSVITFNGTQFANVTVNGESFELDLSKRGGRGPLVRRR